LQSPPDRFLDAVPFLEDIGVPEPQDAEASVLEPNGALGIVFPTLGVLTPIEFQDELAIEAHEIRDERADRHLPSKLEARETAISQPGPDEPFGLGEVLSEFAGAGALYRGFRSEPGACSRRGVGGHGRFWLLVHPPHP
jgi:hypothetical protein